MKLSKRIAIAALAAVMALSMLTACGGDGNGNGSGSLSTGGNTDSNSEANSSSNSETNTETKPGTGKDDTTTDVSRLTSRAAKYFARQGVNGKTRYIRYCSKIDGIERVEACDGRRRYFCGPARDSENRLVTEASIIDVNQQLGYSYCVGDKNKELDVVSEKIDENDVDHVSYIPYRLSLFSAVAAEPMKIDGVEYYCEKDETAYMTYYCFDKADAEGLNLKYIVKEYGDGTSEIIEIREVKAVFDPELLRIPEGYERYDVYYNEMTNEYSRTYVGTTGKDGYPN